MAFGWRAGRGGIRGARLDGFDVEGSRTNDPGVGVVRIRRGGQHGLGGLWLALAAMLLPPPGRVQADSTPLVVVLEQGGGVRAAPFRRALGRRLSRPVRSFVRHGTSGAWAVLLVAMSSSGCSARLRLRTRDGRVFEGFYRERRCARDRRLARLTRFAERFVQRAERTVLSGGGMAFPVFSELIDPWGVSLRTHRGPRVRSTGASGDEWLVSPVGELLDPFAVRRSRPASQAAVVHEVADPWRGRGRGMGVRRLTPPRRGRRR